MNDGIRNLADKISDFEDSQRRAVGGERYRKFLDKALEDLEAARLSQDAGFYTYLANNLGDEQVLDLGLYERGIDLVEKAYHLIDSDRRLEDQFQAMETYRSFARDARFNGVRAEKYEADPVFKKISLEGHFPGKFGKNGSQPIESYSGAQLGKLYAGVLNTAKKYA